LYWRQIATVWLKRRIGAGDGLKGAVLKILTKAIDWLEEIMLAVGLFAMAILNFVNIICRYLLPQTPFSFTEESMMLLFMWITMLGISCGYKRSSHTSLSLVTDALPKSFEKPCLIVSMACSGALMILLFWSGAILVQNQLRYGNTMPGLKISAAWGGMAIPAGAAIILFRVLQVGAKKLAEKAEVRVTP
jgi:TRAP-type C4-dicarboxylate transport system permease small subunit